MKSIAIIPARFESSRFPGKPLIDIMGKPMIYWVYQRCLKAGFDEVVVATDDDRIIKGVSAFGGKVMMTASNHESGTSRCIEVSNHYKDYEIIVNVQGDEPLVNPDDLRGLIQVLQSGASIASLFEFISEAEAQSEHTVKLVLDRDSNALYFSRSLIPFPRNEHPLEFKKHVGVYAFRKEVLNTIQQLESGNLEKIESLEQLNWLEHGYKIKMILSKGKSIGIDTPEDLSELVANIQKGIFSLEG